MVQLNRQRRDREGFCHGTRKKPAVIHDELKTGRYKPEPVKRAQIEAVSQAAALKEPDLKIRKGPALAEHIEFKIVGKTHRMLLSWR